jgi:hypothetical protein
MHSLQTFECVIITMVMSYVSFELIQKELSNISL